jgi:hypothetical protein
MGPIFVVAVDNDGDGGVLGDILHALERRAGSVLRLRVDRDVEHALVQREAHWHDVGHSASVGGGEVRHAALGQEAALAVGQHGRLFGSPHLTPRVPAGRSGTRG